MTDRQFGWICFAILFWYGSAAYGVYELGRLLGRIG